MSENIQQDFEQYTELTDLLKVTVKNYIDSQMEKEGGITYSTVFAAVSSFYLNTKDYIADEIGKDNIDMMSYYIDQVYNNESNPDKTIEVNQKQWKVIYKSPDVTHIGSGKYKINHEGETYEINGKVLRKLAKDLEKGGSSFSKWFGNISKQHDAAYIMELFNRETYYNIF